MNYTLAPQIDKIIHFTQFIHGIELGRMVSECSYRTTNCINVKTLTSIYLESFEHTLYHCILLMGIFIGRPIIHSKKHLWIRDYDTSGGLRTKGTVSRKKSSMFWGIWVSYMYNLCWYIHKVNHKQFQTVMGLFLNTVLFTPISL